MFTNPQKDTMIDIQILRDDAEWLKVKVAEKGFDPTLVDQALELDEKRRERIAEVEGLRVERKVAAKKTKWGSRRNRAVPCSGDIFSKWRPQWVGRPAK